MIHTNYSVGRTYYNPIIPLEASELGLLTVDEREILKALVKRSDSILTDCKTAERTPYNKE